MRKKDGKKMGLRSLLNEGNTLCKIPVYLIEAAARTCAIYNDIDSDTENGSRREGR